MIDFFVRPWEIYNSGETIEVQGQVKTFQEIRQQLYENVIDELMFVARASEGAVSIEWLMSQPVFIRKKYVESFSKELKERQQRIEEMTHKRKR